MCAGTVRVATSWSSVGFASRGCEDVEAIDLARAGQVKNGDIGYDDARVCSSGCCRCPLVLRTVAGVVKPRRLPLAIK